MTTPAPLEPHSQQTSTSKIKDFLSNSLSQHNKFCDRRTIVEHTALNINLNVIKAMSTLKEAVSTLLKNGAKRFENVVINNVTVTPCEDYTRVALTLDKPVAGYVQNEDGLYEKGETNVIFVSLFSIAAMLKESDELAWAVNAIINNPNSLQVLFSRAKITLLQEDVVAGQVRTNPFTGKEDENVPDHDAIYNHIVDVKLGKMGEIGLEKMLDKLLGA